MVVYGGWLHMWTVNLPDRIRNERDSSSPSFHSNHLERLAFARVILGATALPGRVFAAQPLYQPLGFEALGLRPRRKLARRATLQFAPWTPWCENNGNKDHVSRPGIRGCTPSMQRTCTAVQSSSEVHFLKNPEVKLAKAVPVPWYPGTRYQQLYRRTGTPEGT